MGYQLFYSSDINNLVNSLSIDIEQLCQKDNFKKIVIVIPNENIGKWLKYKLADKIGIFSNIEYQNIEKFLVHQSFLFMQSVLKKQSGSEPQDPFSPPGDKIPEDLKNPGYESLFRFLDFWIQKINTEGFDYALKKLFNKFRNYQLFLHTTLEIIDRFLPVNQAMKNYFFNDNDSVFRENFFWGYADYLFQLFREYELKNTQIYDRWFTDRADTFSVGKKTDDEKFQSALFHSLMNNSEYYSLYKIFLLLDILQKKTDNETTVFDSRENPNSQIQNFCIGFSYFPPLYHRIFDILGTGINLNSYFLTYIPHGYTGIRGNQKGFDFFIYPVYNSFLKAFDGNLQTATVKWPVRGCYIEDKSRNGLKDNDTFFKSGENGYQPGILPLKSVWLADRIDNGLFSDIPSYVLSNDQLEIKGFEEKKSEVRYCFEQIIELLSKEEDLSISDFALFITNLDEYYPYLHQELDRYGISQYTNISDLKAARESHFISGLTVLLEIFTGTLTRQRLFSFLGNPLVQEKFGFNENFIVEWLEYFYKLSVPGDNDTGDNRTEKSKFSFEKGISKIVLSEIMAGGTLYKGETRVSELKMDFQSKETMIFLIDLLEKKKKEFSDLFYKQNLNSVISGFFEQCMDDFFSFEEKGKNDRFLMLFLIEKLSQDLVFPDKSPIKISREKYLLYFIDNIFSSLGVSKGEYLTDGLTITGFIPMRPIPFKYIYILGLSAELFPGKQENKITDLQKEELPLNNETINNYLFLETVFSAEKKITLTYENYDNKKDSVKLISSTIIKFLQVLEEKGCSLPEEYRGYIYGRA